MALIKCPECEREISDKAANCIHCGYPISQQQKASTPKPKYNNTEFDSSKFRTIDGARSLGDVSSNSSKKNSNTSKVGHTPIVIALVIIVIVIAVLLSNRPRTNTTSTYSYAAGSETAKSSSYSSSSSKSSSYSRSTSSSFTNKYGTRTTKCAHPGCNNYIASSGDTNCCTTHSKRCAECGKYIDEDAYYCMDCITKALGK